MKSDGYCPPLRQSRVTLDSQESKVMFLVANGYLDAEPADSNRISENDILFRRATLNWQDLAGLRPDGDFREVSVRRTEDKCCGLPDLDQGFVWKGGRYVEWSVQEACTRKWATKELTCTHNMTHGNISNKELDRAWWQAKLNWNAVCGINFTRVPYAGQRSANFVHEMESMDGSSGKLAYHYLPNCNEPAQNTLFGRFDRGERWSFNFMLAVGGHEDGHGLGLGHDTSRDALLYPYYQSNVLKPTQRDIKRVVARYGQPKDGPTPDPTPPAPTPGTLEQRVLSLEVQTAMLWELMRMS